MPKSPTTRLSLPRYEDSETASFSAQVNAISEAIDAKAMVFVADTFAKRPAAGINGRYFLATDGKLSGTTEGDLYFDNGTVWSGPRNLITSLPIGSLIDSASAGDPADADGVTRWLVCDGRAISRTTYAALFAKLSTTYGVGNGSATFNIPNMAGKTAVQPDGVAVAALGSVGGEAKHTLSTAEMPSHTHSWEVVYTDPGSHQGGDTRIMDDSVAHAFTTISSQPTGGGGAHNNMQPSSA